MDIPSFVNIQNIVLFLILFLVTIGFFLIYKTIKTLKTDLDILKDADSVPGFKVEDLTNELQNKINDNRSNLLKINGKLDAFIKAVFPNEIKHQQQQQKPPHEVVIEDNEVVDENDVEEDDDEIMITQ